MNTRELTAECRLAHWAQVLQKRATSGETVKDFCQTRGITRNTFFYWQRKLRKAVSEQFAESRTEATQTGMVPRGFTEVKLSGFADRLSTLDTSGGGSLCVEIGGMRITADRAYPPAQLAELLKWMKPLC